MRRFHHVGAITDRVQTGEIYVAATKVHVTNPADRTGAAKFIESRYGKLDILVNNAGVGPTDGIIGLRASA